MQLKTALPHLAGLRVEQLRITAEAMTVQVAACAATACCPACGQHATRVQSRYQRTLADRPVGGRRLTLILRVRRFVCHNDACARRIFAERFPTLAEPYARRTTQHQDGLRQIGLALGGRAGARLAERLGFTVSHDTVLRLAAAAPTPPAAAPRVVGIDDFAFRRGLTYDAPHSLAKTDPEVAVGVPRIQLRERYGAATKRADRRRRQGAVGGGPQGGDGDAQTQREAPPATGRAGEL